MKPPHNQHNETLEQRIRRARIAGQNALDTEPRAQTVRIDAEHRTLIVTLNDGRAMSLRIDELQEIHGASPDQLQNVEITPQGFGLHWEELDADLYIPALARGVYGTRRWMERLAEQNAAPDKRA